jgi:hypothetical protein
MYYKYLSINHYINLLILSKTQCVNPAVLWGELWFEYYYTIVNDILKEYDWLIDYRSYCFAWTHDPTAYVLVHDGSDSEY